MDSKSKYAAVAPHSDFMCSRVCWREQTLWTYSMDDRPLLLPPPPSAHLLSPPFFVRAIEWVDDFLPPPHLRTDFLVPRQELNLKPVSPISSWSQLPQDFGHLSRRRWRTTTVPRAPAEALSPLHCTDTSDLRPSRRAECLSCCPRRRPRGRVGSGRQPILHSTRILLGRIPREILRCRPRKISR